jgi:hypothetical protein
MRSSASAILLLVMLTWLFEQAWAAEVVSSERIIPKPTALATVSTGALAFADPQAVRQRVLQRQNELRLHHRPIPAGRSSAETEPQDLPPHKVTVVPTLVASPVAVPVKFRVNRALTASETGGSTSTVSEPTAARLGKAVLITGNWFAAWSSDAGKTFIEIDPGKQFPAAGAKKTQQFCCDQIAYAVPGRNLLLWYLQYLKDGKSNTARLAVARGENRRWSYYDFTPELVGGWQNEWFDYPDVAASDNFLYITTNAFSTVGSEPFTRAVVMRVSLDELDRLGELRIHYLSQSDVGSLQAVEGSGQTMYFGTHSGSGLRVYAWPEASATLQTTDVAIEPFEHAGYVITGPDGRDWMARTDDRITAGWQTADTVGFAWTAAGDAAYPHPHVRVAMLDKKDLRVRAQPHIWAGEYAYGYPAVAPNSKGQLGISLMYGGTKVHPSHVVGVYGPSGWQLVAAAQGKLGPADSRWGDYLSIQAQPDNAWLAVGFSLQSGGGPQDIAIQQVVFEAE